MISNWIKGKNLEELDQLISYLQAAILYRTEFCHHLVYCKVEILDYLGKSIKVKKMKQIWINNKLIKII